MLQANVDALVNTVNCVGIMGKGIALQFRQAFPDNYRKYQEACRAGVVQPGRMFVVETEKFVGPKYIINFPTKRHWRGKSRLSDIREGLSALAKVIQTLQIRSIAVPPLGCGSGGLDWGEVSRLIQRQLSELPNVQVLVFAPQGAPAAEEMRVATAKPRMTRGRALLLALLDRYGSVGYGHTMLEVQKLAYFLQAAGERLRLRFTKYILGPYAENLHHVLQNIEGHYVRGYGDRSNRAEITLLPGARDAAVAFLQDDKEASERIDRVSRLIDGFETPYGLELLATIHWIVSENSKAASDVSAVVRGFADWNRRKREIFREDHIRKGWARLRDEGWFSGLDSDPVSAEDSEAPHRRLA
ncbi:MAG: macro domain-containing protein [Terriglobales bacterium]